tara:strand:+ start:413 stop:1603 length:1191 start_codon:yes stop_codon:yes gene_type:complete
MSNSVKAKENLSDIWKLKRRGKRDSARHKELVRDAIKKNGKKLITEYNIITSDGDKKIKIPIRFLDQYKFRYGDMRNKKKSGQGLDAKPGDKYKLRSGKKKKVKIPGKPGNEEGERYFEADVTIDEMVDILLEELNLPWLDPTTQSSIEIDTEELSSVEKVGINPNLDLKRTILENLKRNAAKGNPKIENICKEDLRYKTWETNREYHSNAAVYLMMDRSGSMSSEKTYIAKSFYFWMVQFLKRKYKKVELIFIAHDAKAFIVNEEQFFGISSAGGTCCSTAFELAYDHITANHPPSTWNNYVFEFSDGDNWGDDNLKCIDYVNKLIPLVRAIGYGEIIPRGDNSPWFRDGERLSDMFNDRVKRTRFVSMKLTSKDDVFDSLKMFFNIDGIAKKAL